MKYASIIEKLLSSEEPSIRWRTRVNVLGESRESLDIISLENEIKNSIRVRTILKNRTDDGRINNSRNVYDKWQGAHWILISLSDIGYPRNDADFILSRRLYLRLSNGKVINDEFIKLHYPLYWHYDILSALKVFAEFDLIYDPRCIPALDLLESKQLEDGGWLAEGKYYSVNDSIKLNADYVDWGGTSKKTFNEWVTTDALYVLSKANRIY